jgi:hypothetical protein
MPEADESVRQAAPPRSCKHCPSPTSPLLDVAQSRLILHHCGTPRTENPTVVDNLGRRGERSEL